MIYGEQVSWSLVLGFCLSALLQAIVPADQMRKALGRGGAREIALATVAGAASSSCSYASAAIMRTLFKKGAALVASLAFLFASTNLVLELGVKDVAGKVEQITLRETYLRHLSNELVLVPNSFLFKNPVKILTDATKRRHQVEVGVGYGVDLEDAARVIEAAVRSAEGVDPDQRIDVLAKQFGDSSIDFLVRWWAGSKPIDAHRSRDAVVRAIKRALDEAGMEIPFPYQTLTFKEPLPLMRARRDQPPAADPRPTRSGDEDGF